ncbi:MAG: 4Fe-4S dicluster domain-containing protein, partial [Elusimicrobiota bacterium]
DADFLGTWISPVGFTKAWSKNRAAALELGLAPWHIQFESRYSVSGGAADVRVALKPTQLRSTLLALGAQIAKRTGYQGPLPGGSAGGGSEAVEDAAVKLLAARGASLVLCGLDDIDAQVVTNWINHMLRAYGESISMQDVSLQAKGDAAAMTRLIEDMRHGKVGALFIHDVNPAYDHAQSGRFIEGLSKVPLVVSLAQRLDETAKLARYVVPDHHFLESWSDTQPVAGIAGVVQPTIAPLFDTRSAMESFLVWSGTRASAYDQVRAVWRDRFFPLQKKSQDFERFWDALLRDGVFKHVHGAAASGAFAPGSLAGARLLANQPVGLELCVYPSVALYDGRQANNPWLQELPDPVSKVCWGNVASLSPQTAKGLGVIEGRVVRLKSADSVVELPVHLQPGLADGVVAVALGYGRRDAGAIAANYPMQKLFPLERDLLAGANMFPMSGSTYISVELTGRMSMPAKTQSFDYQEAPLTRIVRDHARAMTLEAWRHAEIHEPAAVRDGDTGGAGAHAEETASIWPKHTYTGNKWAMAVDLNACSGCSACLVACQAENNIPVVGKAEIRRGREMHWLRIDRYYSGGQEQPENEPGLIFQPMLCQQCDNAPCETVCPVTATLHSSDGLNMMVYNRCVGTRYCANNCPYKVRRFNWFDYAHTDLLQNLALNPDITVRSRGVMEKCSFCVQRIAVARGSAKEENRRIKDGEVKPACAQSCPADAIVFGDSNDVKSKVAKLAKDRRDYRVIHDLGTEPNVHYLAKVRHAPH